MRYIAVVGAAVAFVLLASPARATDFDDKTRCSALTRTLDAENQADILRSAKYLLNTFKDLDPLLFDRVSAAEMGVIVRDVASLCAFRPHYFVRHAAASVYAMAAH